MTKNTSQYSSGDDENDEDQINDGEEVSENADSDNENDSDNEDQDHEEAGEPEASEEEEEEDAFDIFEKMPGSKSASFYKEIEQRISALQDMVKMDESWLEDTSAQAEEFRPLFVLNVLKYTKNEKTDKIFSGQSADPYSCVLGRANIWKPSEFTDLLELVAKKQGLTKQESEILDMYKKLWLEYWYPRFSDEKDIEVNKEKAVSVLEEWLNSEDWAQTAVEENGQEALNFFQDNFGNMPFKDLENETFILLLTGELPLPLPKELVRGKLLESRIQLFGVPSSYLENCEKYIWRHFADKIKDEFGEFSEKNINDYFTNLRNEDFKPMVDRLRDNLLKIKEKVEYIIEVRKKDELRQKKYQKLPLNEKRELWAHYLSTQKHKKSMRLMDSQIEKNKRLEEIAEEEAEERARIEEEFLNIQLRNQAQERMKQNKLLKQQMRAAEESQKASKALQDSAKKSSSSLPPKLSTFKPSPPTSRKKPQIVYAIQQGSNVAVYGENNVLIRSLSGMLKGYTTETFTIQTGNLIYIYNSDMTLVRSYKA